MIIGAHHQIGELQLLSPLRSCAIQRIISNFLTENCMPLPVRQQTNYISSLLLPIPCHRCSLSVLYHLQHHTQPQLHLQLVFTALSNQHTLLSRFMAMVFMLLVLTVVAHTMSIFQLVVSALLNTC